jgi:hypothetical protein
MNIYYISLVFQLLCGILPLLIVINRKAIYKTELVIFLLSSVIATIGIFITTKFQMYNHYIHNSYLIIEILCLCQFYFKIFNSKKIKAILFSVTGLLLAISILEVIKIGVMIFSMKIISLCIILISLFYLLNNLMSTSLNHINQPVLLINSSFIVYHGSSFILIYFIMNIMSNNLWHFHNFIEGISKLIIAYAFWKLPKKDTILETKN